MAQADLLAFPQGFLWGTATAAHQVEGGNDNNDWWAWEQIPGHIEDGSHSGKAADWWGERGEQDLSLAAQGGQNSHRLSLEWSRLEPREGEWNADAVTRYRRLLAFAREQGLEPMITLWHFTLPLWVAEQGGWETPATIGHYLRFVERVLDAFGDQCSFWCTINEPQVCLPYGYLYGIWPPGGGGLGALRTAFRHLAAAHAQAYALIHRLQPQAQVGMAHHLRVFDPADPHNPLDRAVAGMVDYLMNTLCLTAFTDGALLFPVGSERRAGTPAERRAGTPAERVADYIGVNYYSRDMVAFDARRPKELFMRRFAKPDALFSMEGWGEVYAEGLYRVLKRAAAWQLPLYVTEFGVPDNTDTLRPRYIVEHVAAMHRALQEGVDLRGAYFWSLVDNWEWAAGWKARFGLLGVDPLTQERTVRGSSDVYLRICKSNGLERSQVHHYAPELEGTWYRAGTPAARGAQ